MNKTKNTLFVMGTYNKKRYTHHHSLTMGLLLIYTDIFRLSLKCCSHILSGGLVVSWQNRTLNVTETNKPGFKGFNVYLLEQAK